MLVRFDVGFDVGFDVRLRVLLQNCRTDAHEGVNEGAQGCKLECCVADLPATNMRAASYLEGSRKQAAESTRGRQNHIPTLIIPSP